VLSTSGSAKAFRKALNVWIPDYHQFRAFVVGNAGRYHVWRDCYLAQMPELGGVASQNEPRLLRCDSRYCFRSSVASDKLGSHR